MTPEQGGALHKEFPTIIKRDFYFECGGGWHHLVRSLCRTLQDHADNGGRSVRALEIKEKFGGLRFYYDSGGVRDDHVTGAVAHAERISEVLCQFCGRFEHDAWSHPLEERQ